MSPAGAEGKRVEIERPETPERVRAKLVEGELHYTRLAGEVAVNRTRIDAQAEQGRVLREEVMDVRDALRDLARDVAKTAAATRSEIGSLRADMDHRLDRIEQIIIEQRARGQSAQVEGPATGPITALESPLDRPITSAGQARRAAVVGGGGVGLATILGVVTALGSLPPPLQWALVALAVIAGVAAVAVALRWGWVAAGR